MLKKNYSFLLNAVIDFGSGRRLGEMEGKGLNNIPDPNMLYFEYNDI